MASPLLAMRFSPMMRRTMLTMHVVSSVGWLGSVGCFLALAVAGLEHSDAMVVRAAYVATDLVTWRVIVPLAGATLLTGVVQSLGTAWGLVRHYWVITKLLLTLGATALLLLHTQPIEHLAAAANRQVIAGGDLRALRVQLVGDATAALAVLAIATVLSIFKPQGITPYGWRRQREEARDLQRERTATA
jgi:hypothetical protein